MRALELAIEQTLARHLSAADGDTPPILAESIRYSLLAPGKRIRPRLALACAEMLGLKSEAAFAAAVALEMVHCFTLIHDDLPCMDDDDFRRGRPSNHKKFDEATALLAGDALMAVAVDALLDAAPHVPGPCLAAALRRLAWAMGPRGVIGGQSAESALGEHSTLGDLRAMHAMKTGALFAAALLVPADLAGIAPESEKGRALDAFSRELGLSFQIVDDLDDAGQDRGADANKAHAEGESPYANILHYLPAGDARSVTLERLTRACGELARAWGGSAAGPLLRIADEVASRLHEA